MALPGHITAVKSFEQSRADICASHDTRWGPDHKVQHRPLAALSQKSCAPYPGSMLANNVTERLAVQKITDTIQRLETNIKEDKLLLSSATDQLDELAEIVLVIMSHIRGSAKMRADTPSEKRRYVEEALAALNAECPDLVAKMRDFSAPNTPMAALVDSFFKTIRFGDGHARFPPVLLHLALMISNSSKATYRKLCSAFSCLPSQRTVDQYNNTGDFQEGTNKHLLNTLLNTLWHETPEGSLPDLETWSGYLEWDEMSILQVVD